jgi:tetratricopeptide (TPR) repeat protein
MRTVPTRGPRRSFAPSAAVAAALAAVGAVIYRNVGEYAFVFDDGGFIVSNAPIQGGLSWESVRWAFTATHTANWHPLTWLSHLLDVTLFGLDPGPPHLVNVLIHLVNTVLLFHLLRRLTGALWRSAFVAAIFAAHPLHVESVAWVSERKDVLSALLWLLATTAYARYASRRSAARYLLVVVLLALGFTAKAMVVTLPVVFLLLDWWPLGRVPPGRRAWSAWRTLLLEKLPLLAISAAGAIAAVHAQRSGGALASFAVYQPAWRAANAVISYVVYLIDALWPAGLAAYYPFRIEAPSVWQTAGAALLVAGLTGASAWLARRVPSCAMGWAWYLLTLLPVIGLVQVGGQARADRYMYLPLIGLTVAAVWGLAAVSRRLRMRPAVLAGPAAAVLVLLSVTASLQAEHWRSNATLFQHAVAVTRDNWVAHNFLGVAAGREGRLEEAMAHYREAVRINPSSADMRYNLGLAFGEMGRQDDAIRELRLALHLDPTLTEARYRLGVSLSRAGRLPEALETLRAAARAFPDRFDVWNDTGDAAFRLGRFAEAEAAFAEALRLRPGDALVRWNLQQARERRR